MIKVAAISTSANGAAELAFSSKFNVAPIENSELKKLLPELSNLTGSKVKIGQIDQSILKVGERGFDLLIPKTERLSLEKLSYKSLKNKTDLNRAAFIVVGDLEGLNELGHVIVLRRRGAELEIVSSAVAAQTNEPRKMQILTAFNRRQNTNDTPASSTDNPPSEAAGGLAASTKSKLQATEDTNEEIFLTMLKGLPKQRPRNREETYTIEDSLMPNVLTKIARSGVIPSSVCRRELIDYLVKYEHPYEGWWGANPSIVGAVPGLESNADELLGIGLGIIGATTSFGKGLGANEELARSISNPNEVVDVGIAGNVDWDELNVFAANKLTDRQQASNDAMKIIRDLVANSYFLGELGQNKEFLNRLSKGSLQEIVEVSYDPDSLRNPFVLGILKNNSLKEVLENYNLLEEFKPVVEVASNQLGSDNPIVDKLSLMYSEYSSGAEKTSVALPLTSQIAELPSTRELFRVPTLASCGWTKDPYADIEDDFDAEQRKLILAVEEGIKNGTEVDPSVVNRLYLNDPETRSAVFKMAKKAEGENPAAFLVGRRLYLNSRMMVKTTPIIRGETLRYKEDKRELNRVLDFIEFHPESPFSKGWEYEELKDKPWEDERAIAELAKRMDAESKNRHVERSGSGNGLISPNSKIALIRKFEAALKAGEKAKLGRGAETLEKIDFSEYEGLPQLIELAKDPRNREWRAVERFGGNSTVNPGQEWIAANASHRFAIGAQAKTLEAI